MSAERRALVPDGHSRPVARYSPGLSAPLTAGARLVAVSGQVPVDARGTVRFPDDAGRQAEFVFDALEAVLVTDGLDLSHVVAVTVYLVDRGDFGAVSAVRDRRMPVPAPSSTLVYVAGLVEPGVRVEISALAVS
ncbi:RidA family protein [Streptomyces sp. NPDC051994]|uniref:RidA family protein n=1 Tax=unclassified Streptomyces TaxID=2593676 RepID=UPI0034211763